MKEARPSGASRPGGYLGARARHVAATHSTHATVAIVIRPVLRPVLAALLPRVVQPEIAVSQVEEGCGFTVHGARPRDHAPHLLHELVLAELIVKLVETAARRRRVCNHRGTTSARGAALADGARVPATPISHLRLQDGSGVGNDGWATLHRAAPGLPTNAHVTRTRDTGGAAWRPMVAWPAPRVLTSPSVASLRARCPAPQRRTRKRRQEPGTTSFRRRS